MLAVASGGGHWAELCRVVAALEGFEIVFVTVDPSYGQDVAGARVHIVPDASLHEPVKCARLARSMWNVLVRELPDVVLSTGAAPGAAALCLARLLGARTIWLDSLANAERMSMSGRLVRPFAGLWLTQWPELARPQGPEFVGQVL